MIHTPWKITFFLDCKSCYLGSFFVYIVYMLLCTNPHVGWLNPIYILIDMTQRSILRMVRLILLCIMGR